MVCCCAVGCSNRFEKGYRIYNFPADKHRRAQWVKNVNRADWEPTRSSRVCEVHFEVDQFELGRKDGKMLLKPYAVPTLFGKHVRKAKLSIKPPKRLKNLASPAVASQHDHCYKMTRGSQRSPVNCDLERVCELTMPTSDCGAVSETQNHEAISKCNNSHSTDSGYGTQIDSAALPEHCEQPCSQTYAHTPLLDRVDTAPCSGSCKERITALQVTNEELAVQLAKEKEISLIREASLKRLFNEDQLQALNSRTPQNWPHVNWCEATLKKCVEMKCAVGERGYEYLRNTGFPLPSLHYLYENMHKLQYEAETLTEEPDAFSCEDSPESILEEQNDTSSLYFDDQEDFCRAISI